MTTRLADLAERTSATRLRIDRLLRTNEVRDEPAPAEREISQAEHEAMEEIHGSMAESDK